MKVRVDTSKCIGCGKCKEVCPVGVFKIIDGKSHPVNAEACVICRACIMNCPVNCIEISARELRIV